MLSKIFEISSKKQLTDFSKALLSQHTNGVFYLHGDLGAGKTTFAQTLIKQLGYTGIVQSPTYSIMHEYPLPNQQSALHADLYRLADAEELLYLDVREWKTRARWILIEWPERGADLLPSATLNLRFRLEGTKRFVDIF